MNKKFTYKITPLLFFFAGMLMLPVDVFALGFTVKTLVPSYVSESSAIFQGRIDITGNDDNELATVWFEWGDTTSLDSGTVGYARTKISSTRKAIAHNIEANTTYYYRFVAEMDGIIRYGGIMSFNSSTGKSTLISGPSGGSSGGYIEGLATIVTHDATQIFDTGARVDATINTTGDNAIGWFEWGTSSDLGRSTSIVSGVSDSFSSFSQVLTGLTPGTTYYYRAVVKNDSGINYGNVLHFTTTLNGLPVVAQGGQGDIEKAPETLTSPAIVENTSRATLKGIALFQRNFPTEAWFEWGTDKSLGNTTQPFYIEGGENIPFETTISGLSSQQVYYYRAVTRYENMLYKGVVFVFRTDGVSVHDDSTGVIKDGGTTSQGGGVDGKKDSGKTNGVVDGEKELTLSSVFSTFWGALIAESTATTSSTVAEAGSKGIGKNGQASSFFAGGTFLPDTLIEWFILIILLLIIILLSNHIYGMNKKRKEEKKKREEMANIVKEHKN